VKSWEELVEESGFVPPSQAVEVEKHVIGAMLFDSTYIADVRNVVSHVDFFLERHQVLLENIFELDAKGVAVDLITLSQQLKANNVFEAVGGDRYLLEIAQEVVSAANVGQHAKIVLEMSQRRILNNFLSKALDHTRSDGVKAQEVINLVEAGMLQLTGRQPQDGPILARKALPQVFKNIEALATGKLLGLPTGYRDLDIRLGGLENGKMYVVAGIPGSGKTVLAVNIGWNLAKEGVPGVVFSMEMGRADLVTRILVGEAKVDSGLLRSGRLPQRDYPRLSLAITPIDAAPLYVDEASTQTPASIRSKMRRFIADHGVRWMVVDYFQLMTDDRKHKSRYDELTQVSIQMTKLAKDLNVPLIMCAQLDKESAKGGVPTLGNLKETGQLGQDATSVLIIHRPAMFAKKLKEEPSDDPFDALGVNYGVKSGPPEHLAQVIAEKNRQGIGTGVEKMSFLGKYQRFIPWSDKIPDEWK
jgi:replicative DNA helicase